MNASSKNSPSKLGTGRQKPDGNLATPIIHEKPLTAEQIESLTQLIQSNIALIHEEQNRMNGQRMQILGQKALPLDPLQQLPNGVKLDNKMLLSYRTYANSNNVLSDSLKVLHTRFFPH